MTNHFTRKYLEAFPFLQFGPLEDSSQFLYMHEKEGIKKLKLFDLNQHTSLEDGEKLADVDFNKQSYLPLRKVGEKFYMISDQENKENFNIFALDLKTKEIEQKTHHQYTCCIRITDEGIAYYASRTKNKQGLFKHVVHIHNLNTGESQSIIDDNDDEYRLGWGKITPTKNEKYLIANVDRNNSRTNNNFILIDREEKTKNVLVPKAYESARFYLLDDEVDTDKGFYFVSDCSGFDNLYYFYFVDSKVRKLTDVDFLTDGFHPLEVDGKRYFCLNRVIPSESKTLVITYREETEGHVSRLSEELEFTGDVFIMAKEKDFIWVGESDLVRPPVRNLYRFRDSKWSKEFKLPFLKEGSENLVHSTYEYVTYPSFDGLEIPAYVIIPKGEIKGAVIVSFYGGGNDFNPQYQILAEMGFVTLSPAVRGSWGHGKEWEEMLKGDLGGNEILDLLWGAKFLEKKLNLKPHQIGLEGGSHGGYATLRALTLPENFKGQDSQYPFGFGICRAGFADIEDFYKTTNIPDWVVNMLGPYEENKELYAERSPVHYFEQLKAPLFITHGTKDSRVPGSTMEGFLEELKKSEVPHYIYLMDGQGHTSGSIDERVDVYKKMFSFLEQTTRLGWSV